jgi:hypothetical protein
LIPSKRVLAFILSTTLNRLSVSAMM